MNNLRDIQPLLYDFYLVAKEGGYSNAANKYLLQQSNLSKRISSLEEQLNLKLINSNNKGITLTAGGERLYALLEPLYENIAQINNNEQLSGKLIIGTTRNIADNRLSKYLTEYHKLYPNVKIDIIIDSASNLNDYLVNHKIDLLIDYLPQINSSQKYDFTVKCIANFNTCFACSNEFYENYGKSIKKMSDLKDFELVIPGSSRRRQFLDELLQSNNLELNPIIQMPDSKLMADFVKENNCIGYFITDEIKDYNLKELTLNEVLPKNSIGIIYPSKTLNSVGQKFVGLIAK